MDSITQQLSLFVNTLHTRMFLLLGIIALLCFIHIINAALGYRLNALGIYPRHPFGLLGIICSPFLHGSFSHLFFNAIPLFILMAFMLNTGLLAFVMVSALIMLISGTLVWLFGRRALHVGASSVIMGYWGYLLTQAILSPSLLSIGLIILCVYYFGGFITSLLPLEEKTSLEGHVFGFLAGILIYQSDLASSCYQLIKPWLG
jgi:membrane associated rhomboid family serine protease